MSPVFVEAALPTVPGVPDLTTTVRAAFESVVPAAFFNTTAIVAACADALSAFETTVAESAAAPAVTVSPV
jgi:hypothetical protein